MHLCTTEITGVTVYHPTEVNGMVLGGTAVVFTHKSTAFWTKIHYSGMFDQFSLHWAKLSITDACED